jgi:hypothetical protein
VRNTNGQPAATNAAAARPGDVAHSKVRLLTVGVTRIAPMAVIAVRVMAHKVLRAKVTVGDIPLL